MAAVSGMGFAQHAGLVIVCDGTEAAARRIERVLWNDPATGVMRHADAGYEAAIEHARLCGLKLPMVNSAGGRCRIRRCLTASLRTPSPLSPKPFRRTI